MKIIKSFLPFVVGGLYLSVLSCTPVTSPKPSGPATPTGVTAVAGDGHILVTWIAVAGATSYNVYYTAGMTVNKFGSRINTAASPCDLINLANGTKEAIAVSAVDANGESDLSIVDTATPTAPVETVNITLGLSSTTLLAGDSIKITGNVDASSQPTIAYTIEAVTAINTNGISINAIAVTGKNHIDFQSDAGAHIVASASASNGTYVLHVTAIVGSTTVSKRDTFTVNGGSWLPSDAEETTMGNNFYLSIIKDSVNYKLYKDTTVVNYVKNLGRGLVSAQTVRPENTDFHYNFDVINNDTVVNAFAMPGGHMFVYTGLILKVHNEAELAGAMYHELGHVILRHGVKALVNQYSVSLLAQLIQGDSSLIGLVVDGLKFLKYSQSNEYEADSVSCELLNHDSYNPYGMPDFLGVLYSLYGDGSLPFEFLSDHPLTSTRITATKRIIGRMSSADTSAAALYASRLTPIVQYIQSH
jgi:hypothetical protein